MRYLSTRGQVVDQSFQQVLMAGLAADGGLFVPTEWPRWTADQLRALRSCDYAQTAALVMARFIGDAMSPGDLAQITADSAATFRHQAVTPLVQAGHRLWVMELFHGPTLAFKDVALQTLARLFDYTLAQQGERAFLIGATSGDTGSAAIEACRHSRHLDIAILHPKGRTSAVQRRQMTTVLADNVHNLAIEGTFDDCQAIVKTLFADAKLRQELRLSAVNSINWARIMAQIVYYIRAAVDLGAPDRPVAFAVPTGNFGNVYAAYAARAMGVPIARLIIGSNDNDILTRFLNSGTMQAAAVTPTLSPSMDIQVSSNFERLLFDLHGRQGNQVADDMESFQAKGTYQIDGQGLAQTRRLFSGYRADQAETLAEIARSFADSGMIIDPHTAVGMVAARKAMAGGDLPPDIPVVALACAHAAKFPDAVEQAIGRRPALPDWLADLDQRPERVTVLPNDAAAVAAFLRRRAGGQ